MNLVFSIWNLEQSSHALYRDRDRMNETKSCHFCSKSERVPFSSYYFSLDAV